MKAEIQDLEDQIRKKKSEIERSIDKMEGGQNIWDKARKGCLVTEMQLILGRNKESEESEEHLTM